MFWTYNGVIECDLWERGGRGRHSCWFCWPLQFTIRKKHANLRGRSYLNEMTSKRLQNSVDLNRLQPRFDALHVPVEDKECENLINSPRRCHTGVIFVSLVPTRFANAAANIGYNDLWRSSRCSRQRCLSGALLRGVCAGTVFLIGDLGLPAKESPSLLRLYFNILYASFFMF